MPFSEGLKSAIELAKRIENKELYQELINLQDQALEFQQSRLGMQQRINELEIENKRLKEIQKINDEYVVSDEIKPFFTLKSEENKTKYCKNCWNENGVKIQFSSHGIHHICPKCKTHYTE